MTSRGTPVGARAAGVPGVAAGVGGVLLLAVGLVWLLGGFRPMPQTGPAAELGEEIDLQRWVIAVDQVECVDFVPGSQSTSVRVLLRITNTTKATLGYLPERMVTVRIGGTELERGFAAGQSRDASAYDPDVESRFGFDYRTEPTTPPEAVTVAVRDEQDRANFVFSDNWVVTKPAALVTAPCPAVRSLR